MSPTLPQVLGEQAAGVCPRLIGGQAEGALGGGQHLRESVPGTRGRSLSGAPQGATSTEFLGLGMR